MMKKETVNIGIVGVGSRGSHLLSLLTDVEGVRVTAVCDRLEDRLLAAKNKVSGIYGHEIGAYFDCRKMFREAALDGVIVATSWPSHTGIAVAAMENGIAPAVECGGADSADEAWLLVRTSERTGVPCMFLENCCYMRAELSLLKMVKMGVFGEITYCEGGYQHDLRAMIANRNEARQERWDAYRYKNAELYHSHELGPIMKWLNINRGNRIVSLVSMASKARGLNLYSLEHRGEPLMAEQGDVVTTLMKCAHGETIRLTYDTTLPRPYSRGARLQGTKGLWMEDNNGIYIEGLSPQVPGHGAWEPFTKYLDDPVYEHELWTNYRSAGVKGGHGGCDFLVLSAFADSLRRGIQSPLDVYDAATIMAITPLSAESIASGGRPVPVPDFTDGRWIKREPYPDTPYKLD